MERFEVELVDLGIASEETKGIPLPASHDVQGQRPTTGLSED